VTLEGLSVAVKPEDDTVLDSVTDPAKPFKLDRVIVEVAVEPAVKLRLDGLLAMLKSGVGVVVLKNSVMGVAAASPVERVARPQFASTVLGNE